MTEEFQIPELDDIVAYSELRLPARPHHAALQRCPLETAQGPTKQDRRRESHAHMV